MSTPSVERKLFPFGWFWCVMTGSESICFARSFVAADWASKEIAGHSSTVLSQAGIDSPGERKYSTPLRRLYQKAGKAV